MLKRYIDYDDVQWKVDKRGKRYPVFRERLVDFSNNVRWTDNERNILRDNYYVLDEDELARLLPNRTRSQMTSQVHYLRKRGWAFKERKKK